MSRCAPAWRRHPRRSARGLPDGISFQWERLPGIARELRPLLEEHYQELEEFKDLLPFDPAWDQMLQYDMLAMLRVLTVRSDGVLVGYLFLFFPPSLHYASSRIAFIERFWLQPAFRQGWTGIKMFREAERAAREAEAVMILATFRLHFANDRGTLAPFFERLGYRPTEATWAKPLQ